MAACATGTEVEELAALCRECGLASAKAEDGSWPKHGVTVSFCDGGSSSLRPCSSTRPSMRCPGAHPHFLIWGCYSFSCARNVPQTHVKAELKTSRPPPTSNRLWFERLSIVTMLLCHAGIAASYGDPIAVCLPPISPAMPTEKIECQQGEKLKFECHLAACRLSSCGSWCFWVLLEALGALLTRWQMTKLQESLRQFRPGGFI